MCVCVRFSTVDAGQTQPHAYYDVDALVVYVSPQATFGQALTLTRRLMAKLGVEQHDTGCTCFCGDCVLLPQYETVSV